MNYEATKIVLLFWNAKQQYACKRATERKRRTGDSIGADRFRYHCDML